MSLGSRINSLRIKKRESLQELADAIEVSKAYIWELEKDRSKNPSLETLTKLANHFETSIGALLDESASIYAYGREFENLDEESLRMLKNIAAKLQKK